MLKKPKQKIDKLALFYRIFLTVVLAGMTGYCVLVPFFEYMSLTTLILYNVFLILLAGFDYFTLRLAWSGD